MSNLEGELSLLDHLQAAVKCNYLSDLHATYLLPSIQLAVTRCCPDDYSLKDWNDAVHYIFPSAPSFHSPESAQRYLLGEKDNDCKK